MGKKVGYGRVECRGRVGVRVGKKVGSGRVG